MALTQQQRDERRREKAERLQEKDLRLKVRPGTEQALLELMEWAGIEEQGEAMTVMIHRLHELIRDGAVKLLNTSESFSTATRRNASATTTPPGRCSTAIWPRSCRSRSEKCSPTACTTGMTSGTCLAIPATTCSVYGLRPAARLSTGHTKSWPSANDDVTAMLALKVRAAA